MINVTFRTLNGQNPQGTLPDNFNLNQFRELIKKILGERALEEWTYICNSKQLRINDETAFNVQKTRITDGCIIQAGKRAISGSMYPSEAEFARKYLVEVGRAVDMMPKTTNTTCPICITNGLSCFQFPCNKCSVKNQLCKGCFIEYLKISDFKYRCLSCRKSIEILALVTNTPGLCALVKTLHEMEGLKRNIDCQICRCGEAKVTKRILRVF